MAKSSELSAIINTYNEMLIERKRLQRTTSDTLRKYFPRSYTPQRMQETIIKLLEQWQRKRQQQHER